MKRCIIAVASIATLLAITSDVAARERLIRLLLQPEAVELPPPQNTDPGDLQAPSFDTPAQSAQKTPLQKGMPYQKGYLKGHAERAIHYVQLCPLKKIYGGGKSVYETVLAVPDPKTGCLIDVPVCLPGCCGGKPAVHGRPGLFGRGITSFQWSCGYKVRVVVKAHGDVVVQYFGS